MPRIELDVAKERIYKKHGNNITMSNYYASNSIASFHCNICGYDWEAKPYSVWTKTGCENCYRNRQASMLKFDYSFVKEYIENQGCILISREYNNCIEKLDVVFECGHSGKISFKCFKRGHRCFECRKKKMSSSQRMSLEEVFKILEKKNLKFIEFPNGYINRDSTVKSMCINGHIETHTIESIKYNNGCTKCSQNNVVHGKGENSTGWKGGACTITQFLKSQIKQWKKDSAKNCNYHCVICGEGHRFDDIHHLYSFFSIMTQSLNELNYQDKILVSDFTEEELFLLTNKVIEKHNDHPLGVCLCRKHHKLFHKYFGIYNNTPEQFEEFKKIIASEQVILN